MKLIESKAEYIHQEEGLEGIYKQIELAGRTAYHSLDKITPDSAKSFVDRMIKSKHGAALEHGTVYLMIPAIKEVKTYDALCHTGMYEELPYYVWKYQDIQYYDNAYSKVYRGVPDDNSDTNTTAASYITTNYRVLQENNWLDDLKYLCSPTEFHEKRYTMRFTCSRAIAQELTRHRVFSYLMESQRYINYSKERHGGEIAFIKPSWADFNLVDTPKNAFSKKEFLFLKALQQCELRYLDLLNEGCTPQQARDVLTNATKTEIVVTGFASDWRHLLDLRLFEKTGRVHPDMLSLMQKAQKAMQEAGIWEDIMSKPSKFD